MFKLIRRLICLIIIAAILFIGLAFWSGGEKFRWFGKTVKEKSEEVGEKADRIKERTDRSTQAIEKAKNKIKDITGKKDEQSD